ncbi:uncharacterized protein [Globicephala melas]|uniref:uncharacterized protein isoform X8 n=1 Tax=Globicephala melas TaxID=9731 RepID=UPI0038736D94
MTHPAGGPGPAAQSARERASRSFLILAPAALVGSGEDLSRTSLLHCFHQSLSSSMASQWTLSGEMTLKVQAILWQGDEAHRPWSQDAWAQISSFLSDIKSRTGPTHAGGGHPTWHSVSQADGDASDRVSSRQEFGPDPTGTQTWKKGKGHSVRTDVRAPSITQAAESPPRSGASMESPPCGLRLPLAFPLWQEAGPSLCLSASVGNWAPWCAESCRVHFWWLAG